MTTTADVKIPTAGWTAAFSPCGECLSKVQDATQGRLLFPGRQLDCGQCMNRFTVVQTTKQEWSRHDHTSIDGKGVEWGFAGFLFERAVYGPNGAKQWMDHNKVASPKFEDTRVGSDWFGFAEKMSNEDAAYVLVAPGVVGVCRQL